MVVEHCAKYSDALLPASRHLLSCIAGLPAGAVVVDSFAGTSKGVDYLHKICGFQAFGVELEPEWAEMSSLTIQGDALALPWDDGSFDAAFVSPPFGNRMADVDMRESVAGTYAKSLGRRSSEGSANHLAWGDSYRNFMVAAWLELHRVIRPGGWFLLNIKDHYRNRELQHVPEWHYETIQTLGFRFADEAFVETPGNRRGTNSELRVGGEHLFLFQRGGK